LGDGLLDRLEWLNLHNHHYIPRALAEMVHEYGECVLSDEELAGWPSGLGIWATQLAMDRVYQVQEKLAEHKRLKSTGKRRPSEE
jgi:hypothetical protein